MIFETEEGNRLGLRKELEKAAPCMTIPSRFMHVAASLVSSMVPPHLCCNQQNPVRRRGLLWLVVA
jgi:hypothetical protein